MLHQSHRTIDPLPCAYLSRAGQWQLLRLLIRQVPPGHVGPAGERRNGRIAHTHERPWPSWLAGRQASRTPPPASPGVLSWRRPGAGLARLGCTTRWRRVHDGRATRWRRVARHFLTTAHMPIFVPRSGVECTICVPLGGSEWHAHETAQLRGHRRRKWRRAVARTPWASHAPRFSM